jgi:transaldolase
MTEQFPQTALWNDSADQNELKQSIEWGGVGATCNPVIGLTCIKADLPRWKTRIKELAAEHPTWTESQIGWEVIEELSIEAAKLLEPAFEKYNGYNGRLSVQTDPRYARDASKLVAQAVHFSNLAKNIIVKIPATSVGIEAIEEATYQGVNINVTVSFSVPQAVKAAEAIERGLDRRRAEGKDVSTMGPVVTIMVGRIDDWLKEVIAANKMAIDLGVTEWAGVAIFKNAYKIFKERGFTSRLLAAAYRNHLQLTEFVGGDVVLSPPFKWAKMVNDNNLDLPERMSKEVDPDKLKELRKIPDFNRAYDEDGMEVKDFDTFGPTLKTLRQFLAADAELDALVRDVILPAPKA